MTLAMLLLLPVWTRGLVALAACAVVAWTLGLVLALVDLAEPKRRG